MIPHLPLQGTQESSSTRRRDAITVAIILHGDPPQFGEVIANVVRQETVAMPISLLCIDDGTSPRARACLQGMRVTLIEVPRRTSIAQAKNLALRTCRDELLLFLDDHIRLIPGSIAPAVAMLRDNPRLAGVCGFYHTRDESDWNVLRDIKRQTIYGKGRSPRLISLEKFTTFSTGIALLRRCALENFAFPENEFPPDFGGEDLPAMIHLLNSGWQLAYHPALEGIHEHGLNGITFLQKIEIEVRGRYSVFIWAVRNKHLTVPYLHGFLHVPVLLVLSLVTGAILAKTVSMWFLAVPVLLLLNECRLCLPCLIPPHQYRLRVRLLAAAYVIGSDLLTVICGIQYLVSSFRRPFRATAAETLQMLLLFLRWEFSKFAFPRVAIPALAPTRYSRNLTLNR